MPRQRIHHSRRTYDFPYDFPQRLVRFKDDAETTRRWREKGVLPNTQNYAALLQMADSLGLGHLFRD